EGVWHLRRTRRTAGAARRFPETDRLKLGLLERGRSLAAARRTERTAGESLRCHGRGLPEAAQCRGQERRIASAARLSAASRAPGAPSAATAVQPLVVRAMPGPGGPPAPPPPPPPAPPPPRPVPGSVPASGTKQSREASPRG